MMRTGGESPEEEKARFKVTLAFAKRVKEILGDAPDIVFEHVGKATLPVSVFTAKTFGKIVICAGTTGIDCDFNVAILWMRQKEIHRIATLKSQSMPVVPAQITILPNVLAVNTDTGSVALPTCSNTMSGASPRISL